MSNPYIVTLWVGEVGYKYSIDLKGVYYKYPASTAKAEALRQHKAKGRDHPTETVMYHKEEQ
jgi:hypothetical protein